MIVDLTEKEITTLLACIESAETLILGRKRQNEDLTNVKRKLSKIAPQERRNSILADLLRG